MEDPNTCHSLDKAVFIIFFQGDALRTRVKKICDGFHATVYPCPETTLERRDMLCEVETRLNDLQTVLNETRSHKHRLLEEAAKTLRSSYIKVRKMKAVYHVLNMFNQRDGGRVLIGDAWMPTADNSKIREAVNKGAQTAGATIPPTIEAVITSEQHPTFNRTNKYTAGFQSLIDAYGVNTYREVNPSVYTIATFPFLFAVMFGDAGHGVIMLSAALFMILREKKLEAQSDMSEIFKIFFGGRYIVFLMSIFSIYTGLIYNDVFSKSLNIFGSSWQVTESRSTILNHESLMLNPARNEGNRSDYHGSPYPFGIDPVWQISNNKIVFLNSFKMKISIIIGVLHMMFGVLMSLWNNKYFGKTVSIIHEFLPQMIFLACMFGYMALLMFHKWTAFSAGGFDGNILTTERCAPSILITFINMVLFKDNEPDSPECEAYMYMGQSGIQHLLVLVAVVCIPWMLLVKPLINKNKPKLPGEETDFTEVMILQV